MDISHRIQVRYKFTERERYHGTEKIFGIRFEKRTQ